MWEDAGRDEGRKGGRMNCLERFGLKDGGFREDKTISCLSVPVYGE